MEGSLHDTFNLTELKKISEAPTVLLLHQLPLCFMASVLLPSWFPFGCQPVKARRSCQGVRPGDDAAACSSSSRLTPVPVSRVKLQGTQRDTVRSHPSFCILPARSGWEVNRFSPAGKEPGGRHADLTPIFLGRLGSLTRLTKKAVLISTRCSGLTCLSRTSLDSLPAEKGFFSEIAWLVLLIDGFSFDAC